MKDYFELLGLTVVDQITGAKGVCTSICFDLYGCVQGCIDTGLDKEGKAKERFWYDVKRFKLAGKRVMAAPKFEKLGTEIGSAEKPAP